MAQHSENPSVLIAIPVYNEVSHASRVLDEVRAFHPEILVVDDGSTDGTPELLSRRTDVATGHVRVIRHAKNSGYGQSLISAFGYADRHGFDWVITMDCDEQHEPRRIPAFLEHIAAAHGCAACPDIISGTRYTSGEVTGDAAPADRKAINMTLTAILNDTLGAADLGTRLSDSFCGFKAHRVSSLARLNLTETGYAFPMQLWPQAALAGLTVEELAVPRIYNDPSRTFGGQLDDPEKRLRHYIEVLRREFHQPAVALTAAGVLRQRVLAGRLEVAIARHTPALTVPLMAATGRAETPAASLCDASSCCCP